MKLNAAALKLAVTIFVKDELPETPGREGLVPSPAPAFPAIHADKVRAALTERTVIGQTAFARWRNFLFPPS